MIRPHPPVAGPANQTGDDTVCSLRLQHAKRLYMERLWMANKRRMSAREDRATFLVSPLWDSLRKVRGVSPRGRFGLPEMAIMPRGRPLKWRCWCCRMSSNQSFPHRKNEDGTIDSICPCCFMTAGTALNEAELSEIEHNHTCDPEHCRWIVADSISCWALNGRLKTQQ